MFLNKNKEVNEIYLDDAPPILFLHPKNDKNFQKYYKKINDKLKKEYNIEPKIIALEKKIEDEFQDRKNLQLKLNTKINEEKKLQNKYNQTTSKKSHITPPKYTFKKHQLSPKLNQNYYDKNNELKLDKNENKSTKTIFSKDTFFFRAMTPTKNIFELNLKNRKNFSSEQKTLQNNVSTNLSDLTKLKSAVQFCSENKYKTSEKLNKLLIPKDINKILLEAKNLIIKKKFKNAETILANLIRREIKHADLFYLMGEAKRLIGINI